MDSISFRLLELKAVSEELKDFSYYIKNKIINENLVFDIKFQPEIIDIKKGLLEIFIHLRINYPIQAADGEKRLFPLVHYDIINVFQIRELDSHLKSAKGKFLYSLDLAIFTTLFSISLSNSRGYIAARTNHFFGVENLLIPIVDPLEIIKDDKSKVKNGRFYFSKSDDLH